MKRIGVFFLWIVLTCPALTQSQPVETAETGIPATLITLHGSLHFTGAQSEDVVAQPGIYRLEQISQSQLGLISLEGREPIVIQALPTTHKEVITSSTALVLSPAPDDAAFHLVLLLPDGTGLDAVGSATEIRTRGGFSMIADKSRIALAVQAAQKFGGASTAPSTTVPATATRPPGIQPSGAVAPLATTPLAPLATVAPPSACPTSQSPTVLKAVVTSVDVLRNTLLSDFKGVIHIPSGAKLDFREYRSIPIKSCVHIKGTRGGLDPGPLLFTNDTTPGQVFQVIGHDVRIEGLRFQGPVPTYTDSQRESNTAVDAIGVAEDMGQQIGVNILIDNNDFWFWTAAITVGWEDGPHNPPLMTKDQASFISITRNYFHRNAREGAGYGVVVGSGYALIESNLFTHNRHAVAHGGYPRSGYIARYNYILEGGFTEGTVSHWNQHFDVHGTGSGHYGGDAGGYFEIAYNTIRGEQRYRQVQRRAAFELRGRPTIGAYFNYNVLVHNDLDAAVSLKMSKYSTGIGEDHEQFNFKARGNVFDADTTGELAVGDFDGDGRDDVFLANGTGWWYSSAGLTEWRFLQPSNLRIKDLRFGRFNADARTDVLFSDGVNWWVSFGGTEPRQWVRNDSTGLTDCIFGDFNGDGITDALRTNGSQWLFVRSLIAPWETVRTSPIPASRLKVGDFNGDGKDDVFFIESNVPGFPPGATFWSYWQLGRPAPDRLLPALSLDIASLVLADFDGDGRTDIAQTDGNGWRWSKAASTGWTRLRDSGNQTYNKDIRSALIGRFVEHDRKVEAIRYELLPRSLDEFGGIEYDQIGKRFVIWKGYGTAAAFAPWTPELQEMR